jgi:hypothetical protein
VKLAVASLMLRKVAAMSFCSLNAGTTTETFIGCMLPALAGGREWRNTLGANWSVL